MSKGQQQKYTNSIYDDITNLTQSVFERTGLKDSFNSAFTNTISKIGEIKTNLIYNVKHSDIPIIPLVQRKQIEIRNDGSYAQLLGHRYDKNNQYKLLFVYRNTFWFSYRHGIKSIQSDNGWGCMIRTVQMVFAETLKRNLKLENSENDKYQIIRHFSQQSQGVLSLSEICKVGGINKRWTSSVEILSICKRIMENYPQHFKFKVQVYQSGVVYKQVENLLFQKYPVMVSLTNRVSLTDIPEQLQPHYFAMMDHPCWVGSIGGVKGQALYIIGSYDHKVIFLDPHYVQSNDQQLDVETYFKKTPRGLQVSELSPSIAFCYYFESKEHHLEWIEWMTSISVKYYPNLVLEFISDKTKSQLDGDLKIIEHSVLGKQMKSNSKPQNPDSFSITVVDEEKLKKESSSQKSGDFEVFQVEKLKKSKEIQERNSVEISNDSDDFELLT